MKMNAPRPPVDSRAAFRLLILRVAHFPYALVPPAVARALTGGKRPSVVYLHNSECTGCTEALLRTYKPYLDELILDTISLDYQETVMAAAGEAAEAALQQAVANPEGFICVVEGAIPTANNGLFGTIGGRTMYDIGKEVLPKAKAVVAYGTCASFGGPKIT